MRISSALRTISWLVRDTMRQSLSYGIFWLLLGITLVSTLVCLSIQVDAPQSLAFPGENPDFLPANHPDAQDPEKVRSSGVMVVKGHMTLAFGAIELPVGRDARSSVHFLQLLLAGGVADTLGLLLTLTWTAGFLPGFLEARSVSILLAKPTPRWMLLLGKYLGVLSFVLLQSMLFIGGTWLAIGLRTQVWDTSYLWSVPLLLLHFAIFFSFSMLLAVVTHNTVVCVFGTIAFWGMTWGMNYGYHALHAADRLMPQGAFGDRLLWLTDLGYWVLPKPADIGLLLHNTLDADHYFASLIDLKALELQGFSMMLSIATSLLFAAFVLITATRRFQATDY